MRLDVIDNHRSRFVPVASGWHQRKMRFAVKSYQTKKNEDENPTVLSLTKTGLKVKTDLSFGKSTENYVGHQIVERGQFVFTPRDFDATPILCGVANARGCISNLYIVFDVAPQIDARFLEYYFWGLKYGFELFEKLSFGMRYSFNRTQFENIPLLHPDLATQRQIVDFLDRETTRIDLLIEKKQRFISVLAQKWAATVTFTLTNGLNPEVPKKDSGVSWIGEIPETWGVAKLGHIGRCANGINIGGDAFGSGFSFVSYGDVYRNPELPRTVNGLVQSSAEDRRRHTLKAGDVLFTRTSEIIDEIGFSSVCTENMPDAVFAGFLIRFRPIKGKLVPLFSKFLFRNERLRAFFSKEMMIVTRASLSQGLLQRMPVVLPPIEEQQEIAQYLQKTEETFVCVSDKTKTSIDRLREYRSALITAAVTGQIDVETYARAGTPDRRLDAIQEEMGA